MFLPYVQPAQEMPPWPPTGWIPDPVCRACGWERTTVDEPDGCLGMLPDVVNACCGHGRLYVEDNEIVQSTEIWLKWWLASADPDEGFHLLIKGGPTLHQAFDAWRAGDRWVFARIVSFLVAEHVRGFLGRRLELVDA